MEMPGQQSFPSQTEAYQSASAALKEPRLEQLTVDGRLVRWRGEVRHHDVTYRYLAFMRSLFQRFTNRFRSTMKQH